MKKFVFVMLCVGMAAGADGDNGSGVRPRPDVADYAAQETNSELTIAAEALSAAEVSNTFATNLNNGWIVVEVALYPKAPVNVDPAAFLLRVNHDSRRSVIRPATAATIAGILQRKEAPPEPSNVTLYPTVGVGYGNGPGYYGRGGGMTTAVGVGVGIGQAGSPPPPASTPADRKTMELELGEKSMPAGPAAKPTAGYLYFPRPAGKLDGAQLELSYETENALVRLALPPIKERKR